jgi:hypothetical protein
MRSTAQADASQGKTKLSCQKTLRLAFYCVIPKAQCSCLFAKEGVENRVPVLFLIQSATKKRDRIRSATACRSDAGITCEERGGVGGKSE